MGKTRVLNSRIRETLYFKVTFNTASLVQTGNVVIIAHTLVRLCVTMGLGNVARTRTMNFIVAQHVCRLTINVRFVLVKAKASFLQTRGILTSRVIDKLDTVQVCLTR
jgi:hypothetical protein